MDESTKKPPSSERENYKTVFLIVVIITLATRFHRVQDPDHVCWDETHFGKMGSWYINRTFFFDVHPPLGKMLIALSGKLTGYDGLYPFEKPGDKYNETNYEGMRYFCTSLGAFIVPMAFESVFDLTGSLNAAAVAAVFLIFDVGMITLNQYILLDPVLLFFMTASIMGMVKVSKFTENHSFTRRWWFWLMFTGTALSCTISVKFVGLFVVLLVGLYTAADLWNILGDVSKPLFECVKQLIARAVALIVWPILLYAVFFYIHLAVLNRSGSGDGFYSSAFQSRLIGNSLYNASMPREVAFGAIITLKNHKTGGGYLHSHYHLYPKGAGARQQQITTYTHKDDNNRWIVKPYDQESYGADNITIVKNGDLVRLEHVITRRNLHSHNEKAPITVKHFQLTGYGENGTGDANDIFKVVATNRAEGETIQTVSTKFKLIHYFQHCAVTTSGKQLPKWGFEQQETSCNPNLRDKSALWNVEDNYYEKLPNVSFHVYAESFLAQFFESHAVQFQGNAGLKPKEGELTSQPWMWPINYKGQFFSGGNFRIYLLGNPILWWSNLAFLGIFIITYLVALVSHQRSISREVVSKANSTDIESTRKKWKSLNAGAWIFIGWILHYLPFWAMGRVLYFHHYFPAVIFNSMLTGVIFDYLTQRMPRWMRHIVYGSALAMTIYSFKLFAPLAYGFADGSSETNSTMHGLRWLDSWEF